MRLNNFVWLFLLVGILSFASVSAWSNNTFNDSTASGTMTFTPSSPTVMKYLAIPVTAISTGYMNISGFTYTGVQRFENYTINDDTNELIHNTQWISQTIKVGAGGKNESFVLTKIGLKLAKTGAAPAFKVSLYSTTADGKPNAELVYNNTFNEATLTGVATWYNITMPAYTLQRNTNYSIVLSSAAGDGANAVQWRSDLAGGSYLGGGEVFSNDDGATWSLLIWARDMMFEMYGEESRLTNLTVGTDIQGITITANGTGTPINVTTPNLATSITSYLSTCVFVAGYCNVPFNFTYFGTGALGYDSLNFSNEGFTENSQTHNSTADATSYQTFVINITRVPSMYPTIGALLYYNGIAHTGTLVSDDGENGTIFKVAMDVPATSGIYNFFWTVSMTTLGGTTLLQNSSSDTQTVKGITFRLCNATTPTVYVNHTFMDDVTLQYVNATFSYQATYYIGTGSTYKTMTLSNSTAHYSYALCLNSSTNASVTLANLSITYGNTGYVNRHYGRTSVTYTNETTNLILYMLGTSNCLISSCSTVFQTVNQVNSPIQGVSISASDNFLSAIVESGVTGSAGTLSMYLNPDRDYTITAYKDGYSTYVGVIRPGSQSVYTIMLQQIGVNISYVNLYEGHKWYILPQAGTINVTDRFRFNVTTGIGVTGDIASCGFDITDVYGNVTYITSFSAAINATLCFVSNTTAAPPVGTRLRGKFYYYRIGATSPTVVPYYNYVVLDNQNITADWTGLKGFFTSLRDIPEWGSNEVRAEFSRIVFFFFMVFLIVGVITFFTGYETNNTMNPGFLMLPVNILVSWAVLSGWFDIGVVSSMSWQGAAITTITRYWWVGIVWAVWIGFMLNYYRRQS